MVFSRPILRSAIAVATLLLVGILWMAGKAGAAEIQAEAAQPYMFSADLEAQIDPLGEDTSCQVEYMTVAAFEDDGWLDADAVACLPAIVPSSDPAQRVTVELSGLASDTEYRYRFIATTGSEVVEGPGGTFHTFGIEAFAIEALDDVGDPDSAAGSHPYELVTRITLPHGEVRGADGAAALAKDVLAELPAGLVGNPFAVEQCPVRLAEERRCSGDSQVGVLKIQSAGTQPSFFNGKIYNVVPAQGSPARFGGEINLSTSAFIDAGLRTGDDYGINAGSFNLPTLANPFVFEIRLWGVPADPIHDPQRSCAEVQGCSVTPGTPEDPFLRNPTRCAGPMQARVKVETYDLPGTIFSREFAMPAITGCDQLEFEPELEARPTNNVADSPTGLHVDLHIPQNEEPEGLGTPDLREAVVKLPPGLTVNPSSAAGLEGCSPEQLGLTTPVGTTPIHTTAAPAKCPDAAKIGTVEVDTPLLDHPLEGAVYLASPYDNPFNSLLAIYIAVDDEESGVVLKLAGHVEVGAEGQLTTTFEENPQLPFEDFKLDFFGGARAALKTPEVCGTYATTSTLTPWSAPESGPPATPSDTYAISSAPGGGSCPTAADQMPNAPVFEAGTESPLAGAYSPFVMRLKREDGSQRFGSVTVTPPPGLVGKLKGIPYCSDSALVAAAGRTGKEEQGAPSCPAASEVGVVNVGAGAGSSPYYVQGRAYLAGPYKGAPLSLAIVTPAVAGPYDLGTVVVRSVLEVEPYTAQITVKSDPIPSELKGIPLDVRSIAVKIDRSQFTLNPTNCEAMSVGGTETSTLGSTAPLSNRFQVGECGKLAFKPKLSFGLEGATKRTGHPAVIALLKMPAGGANIARAQVSLPRNQLLDQGNLDKVCTQPEIRAANCPPRSIYGHAKAWSPLLDQPLEGPVFLGVGYGHELPDLVAELKGQIRVLVHGKVDTNKSSGIRNTFEVVPDAPISKFELRLKGGKKYGLIQNSVSLCKKTQHASARFVGQNGKVTVLRPKIKTSCKKRGAKR
ncbi:MAG TPA: hypothetical protein VFS54_01035 [Solirubrobacterales bacterium]|nr:hypothetical protein [Solirubrobacterales bacterium]